MEKFEIEIVTNKKDFIHSFCTFKIYIRLAGGTRAMQPGPKPTLVFSTQEMPPIFVTLTLGRLR